MAGLVRDDSGIGLRSPVRDRRDGEDELKEVPIMRAGGRHLGRNDGGRGADRRGLQGDGMHGPLLSDFRPRDNSSFGKIDPHKRRDSKDMGGNLRPRGARVRALQDESMAWEVEPAQQEGGQLPPRARNRKGSIDELDQFLTDIRSGGSERHLAYTQPCDLCDACSRIVGSTCHRMSIYANALMHTYGPFPHHILS